MIRIFRFSFLAIVLVLSVVPVGCAYITGEYSTTPESISGWVWSLDESGYSIVIDRQTEQPVRDVTPEEAHGIIGTSERLDYPVIIDVRTPQEYAEGHIHNAVNVDYSSSSFKVEIGVFDKKASYIVYCHSGRRSSAARDIMEGLGFKHVINMTGGFSEWVAAGLPVAE